MQREFNAFKSALEEISTHFNNHNLEPYNSNRCETCINYIGLLKQQLYCLHVNLIESSNKNENITKLIDLIDNFRVIIIQEDFRQNNESNLVKTYSNIVKALQIELSGLKLFNNYGLLSDNLVNQSLGKISVQNNYKKPRRYRGNQESFQNYSNYS